MLKQLGKTKNISSDTKQYRDKLTQSSDKRTYTWYSIGNRIRDTTEHP